MPDAEQFPVEAQATNAHVLQAVAEFKTEANRRFDQVEAGLADVRSTVAEAGLNGHTPLLKAFLEQYAATYVSRQAWLTVRSDIRHRLRFLAPGKHWLGILFAGILGAVGWQFVSQLSPAVRHLFH